MQVWGFRDSGPWVGESLFSREYHTSACLVLQWHQAYSPPVTWMSSVHRSGIES